MANAKIWVSATGERWYPIESLSSMLGVPPAEVRKLIQSGAIPPGQPRGGGSTLYWTSRRWRGLPGSLALAAGCTRTPDQ
jgi:hypothetical protein